MTTTMEGCFIVPADQVTVWANLNDPDVLKSCITGCQSMQKASDSHFVATFRVRMGPLSASFTGKIFLQNIDAPHGCRIVGEGKGGIAGFAKGAADVRLTTVPEGTAVAYAVEANLGGKLAYLGGRMIDGVARRMAEHFFAAFSAAVAQRNIAAAH